MLMEKEIVRETPCLSSSDGNRLFKGDEFVIGKENAKNILVVDDNESIRELVADLLCEQGTVMKAINGLDALSKFAGNHFDIIVSDIDMPVMNGIDFHRHVPGLYKNKFLFFSGTNEDEYINYIVSNSLRLLRKPDDILKIEGIVHYILNLDRYEKLSA